MHIKISSYAFRCFSLWEETTKTDTDAASIFSKGSCLIETSAKGQTRLIVSNIIMRYEQLLNN